MAFNADDLQRDHALGNALIFVNANLQYSLEFIRAMVQKRGMQLGYKAYRLGSWSIAENGEKVSISLSVSFVMSLFQIGSVISSFYFGG